MKFRNKFKKAVQKNSQVYTILQNIYHYRPWKPGKINSIHNLLASYNHLKSGNVFFVQVGSNDGYNGDPIHEFIIKYNWKGILVEPMLENFERLVDNYKNISKNLVFENLAISSNGSKETPFFHVDNSDKSLPDWVNQLGSFDRDVILKHTEYVPGIIEKIRSITLKTESFSQLVARNNLETINLIHIDTEGYDFEILVQVDFKKYNPDIIIYEHKHLKETSYKKSIKLLRCNGYNLFSNGGDTIALHKNLNLQLNNT